MTVNKVEGALASRYSGTAVASSYLARVELNGSRYEQMRHGGALGLVEGIMRAHALREI